MKALRFLIPLVTALASTGLLAHHGAVTNSALYDTDEILELEGELIEILWQNPHTRGRLSVVNDAGEETVWEVELGSRPNSLARRGLAAEDFLGQVKIAGHVARRGTYGLGALHVLLPDGREIVQGNRSLRWGSEEVASRPAVLDPAKVAAAREAADGIFRTWSRRQGMNIEPQLRALDLEFTDRGRELNAAYDPLEDNIEVVECRQGMPDTMFDPVPMEITNEGDRIIIHIDQYDTRRTVYMDPEAAPAEPVPSDTGHSTGRWDGDTLVVTTTHIGWPYYTEIGMPQTDQASYVERFSVSDGGNRLDYSIVIDDPVVLTEPFTLESFREWTPGVEIPPYNCVISWEDFAG